ncbi:MAG: hypothetical protein IKT73_04480, partial [Anaerotignum sp.]|nr:hypothetical protein [Anaerotignum sp.]
MAKQKQAKRMMAMALAAAVAISAVPRVAFAETGADAGTEAGASTTPAEKSADSSATTNADGSTTTKNDDGSTTTTKTETSAEGSTTTTTDRAGDATTSESGAPVDNGSIKVTTTEKDADGNVVDVTVKEVTVSTETTTVKVEHKEKVKGKEVITGTTDIETTIRTETTTETDDAEGKQTAVTVTAKPGDGVVSEVVGTVTETMTNGTDDGNDWVTVETTTVVDREVSMEVKAAETTEEADAVITEVTMVVKDKADLNQAEETEPVEGAEAEKPAEDTRNTDADRDNDVYKADIVVKVEVKENGETKVSVWQGGEKLDEKTTAGGSVSFDNLTLQENQKIDIKLDNLDAVQGNSEVTVQNTTDTTGVSMAFDVDENNKTVVKKATRTFKRTGETDTTTKNKIFNKGESVAFDGKDITVYIYGVAYDFETNGGKWVHKANMPELKIPNGESIPVVIKWVDDKGVTHIYEVDLMNLDSGNGANYKFDKVTEVKAELPENPAPKAPEFNEPIGNEPGDDGEGGSGSGESGSGSGEGGSGSGEGESGSGEGGSGSGEGGSGEGGSGSGEGGSGS